LIDAACSARMAVGETITNMAAASINKLSDIKFSANWMAAAGHGMEDQKLFDAVSALGEDFCPKLGVTIPVGKDSLSMRSVWEESGQQKSVVSPLSVIISGFAPAFDVNSSLTPQLRREENATLIYIDISGGHNRLGGSALAQVYNQVGSEAPDADPELLKNFFASVQKLNKEGKILAYHDRSDGGLFTTLAEMAFAGRCGLNINIEDLPGSYLEILFNEELGAVIQIEKNDSKTVLAQLQNGLGNNVYEIGSVANGQDIVIKNGTKLVYKDSRIQLERWWAETSYRIQSLRDNPNSARQEYQSIKDERDPGLSPAITYKLEKRTYKTNPQVAILREEGVNGQVEMAAAFDKAGFSSVDVHLNDLISGKFSLDDFTGLAACGGFSYGDVLGAGEGWAKSILFNKSLRIEFKNFFERSNTFSLGVCNGCQMLANLKELIPGAEDWPRFLKNSSEQFEARLVSVKVKKSPSIFFKDMEDSIIPVPVAHGEGRAEFGGRNFDDKLVGLQYVDNFGEVTRQYPLNPNGSPEGITALTTKDGRATIMMPHPERAFLTKQLSWHPDEWGENSPWFKIFQNARQWAEEKH
jgi:phosphoribosylformylglycinamidine synthase